MLQLRSLKHKQNQAWKLIEQYSPALAQSVDPRTIEVADFSLTNPGFKEGDRYKGEALDDTTVNIIGLQLLVIENVPNSTLIEQTKSNAEIIAPGYCGKLLIWTPKQFLPVHRHQTVFIVGKDCDDIDFCEPLQDINPEFDDENGAFAEFPTKEFKYLVPKEDLTESKIKTMLLHTKRYGGKMIVGKQETFFVIGGDGWYIGPDIGGGQRIPMSFWVELPVEPRDFVTKELVRVRMETGKTYRIPTNTEHAVIAGMQGLVVYKFSTASWDPADIFSDQRIRKATKLLVPGSNKVITASAYNKNAPISAITTLAGF